MFENGEGGVSGRSGERDQHEHMSVLCDLITRGKMVVMMTVSNLNSRLAVDVKAVDTMNDLLHGGARCLMLQRAGAGGETADKTEGRPVRRSFLVAFSWYPNRCGLVYIKLLVHALYRQCEDADFDIRFCCVLAILTLLEKRAATTVEIVLSG